MNTEPEGTPAVKESGRFITGLWWLVMVEVGLLLTLLPTFMALTIVDRESINPVWLVLFAIPVGPAVQAALFALRRGDPEAQDRPWNRYWEGWRTGWKQSLAVWLTAIVFAAIAFQLSASISPDAIERPLATVALILSGVVTLCSLTALTVISGFSFRTRDLVRVTLYVMGALPVSTAGLIAIVLVVAGLLFIGFESVLLALASVLCLAMLRVVRPMHRVIRDKLTSAEA